MIQKETNIIKDFYAMRFVEYQMKELSNLQLELKH